MSQQAPDIAPDAFPRDPRSFWWRRLSTQNPFYLISAACFIHSLKYATGGESGPLSLYPRLILIGCYLLDTVITALVLVRRYKLWDDTRSLLLIVLLLFCELNLGVDELLATQFMLGIVGEIGVLLTIVVVAELLFCGLPLKFPRAYRIPYYLLWSAIVLWPIACQAATSTQQVEMARWVIAAFSPLCAVLLLALIPAARAGRLGIEPSGNPWNWPLYPWTAFFFLILAVVFRLNALCVSFDSATDFGAAQAYALDNIFAPWMLIPLLFAVAQLVLERALVKHAVVGQRIASLIALACIPLGLSAGGGNEVALTFVQDVTRHLGSPAWLALLGCLAFQVQALLRGAMPAYAGLLATLAIGSCVSPEVTAFDDVSNLNSLWLLVAALLALAPGLVRCRVGLSLVAGMLTIAALRVDHVISSSQFPEALQSIAWWFVDAHLFVAWTLALAAIMGMKHRQMLCKLAGAVLLPLFLIAVLSIYPPTWIVGYVFNLCVVVGVLAWIWKIDVLGSLTGLMGLYVAVRGSCLGYAWAARELRWDGIHWLAGAIVLFVIGLASSIAKSRSDHPARRITPDAPQHPG